MRKNKTKAKLQAGEVAYGINVGIYTPEMVEVLGYIGFDWVFIDAEHGPPNEQSAEDLIRAAELADTTPIVRVPVNRPEVILRFMERGAAGVVVPHVNTAADARAAVEAVKYGPEGHRGMGGLRPSQYGLRGSRAEYLAEANRETMVVVLLEEQEAINNLPDILQVKGVDVFMVGPGDLSQSMGFPGQMNHPKVRETVDHAIAQIVKAGKVASTPVSDADVEDYLKKGIRFVYTHSLPYIIRGGQQFLERAKKAAPAAVHRS
ncbi:MAG: 4-hydroxy-2-oxovalerate aldolase [Chloroflexi bacterium]|nr:4-hydroxy-2-oxovalerate aldolase [Chloroflexota bacterium]